MTLHYIYVFADVDSERNIQHSFPRDKLSPYFFRNVKNVVLKKPLSWSIIAVCVDCNKYEIKQKTSRSMFKKITDLSLRKFDLFNKLSSLAAKTAYKAPYTLQ